MATRGLRSLACSLPPCDPLRSGPPPHLATPPKLSPQVTDYLYVTKPDERLLLPGALSALAFQDTLRFPFSSFRTFLVSYSLLFNSASPKPQSALALLCLRSLPSLAACSADSCHAPVSSPALSPSTASCIQLPAQCLHWGQLIASQTRRIPLSPHPYVAPPFLHFLGP